MKKAIPLGIVLVVAVLLAPVGESRPARKDLGINLGNGLGIGIGLGAGVGAGGSSSGSGSASGSNGQSVMKITMELFRMLSHLIEAVGVQKLEILVTNTCGVQNSVLIGFDGSNIPYPVVSGGPLLPKSFYGNDSRSVELADHKAIMSLVQHLKQTYAIEIHDISHLKIKECELKILEVLTQMEHFRDKLHVFLNKYATCTDDIQTVLSSGLAKHGNILDEIVSSVQEMMQTSVSGIQSVEHKIITIAFEENSYRIEVKESTKKQPLKVPGIIWNISEKEVLSNVVNYLGLLDAKYSSKVTDGGRFIGSCKLNIGKCFGEQGTGRTTIKGKKKNTPYGAECSAAVEAIRFLEHNRGFEIVDFNYDAMVIHKKKLCSLIQKTSKLDGLFGEANKSWGTFVSSLEDFINNQYGLSQVVSFSGEESQEWTAKMDFMSQLEQGLSSMKEVYYEAMSAMATSIE